MKILHKDGKTVLKEIDGNTLIGANLSKSDLSKSNLSKSDLSKSDLSGADLSGADLSGADLRGANLSKSDLREANLREANLIGANLREANLSGATGLTAAADWISKNFEADANGLLVYRAQHGQYPHPTHWEFTPGKFLTEFPNPDRCTPCGCGVSFATKKWVKANHKDPFWKCRIRWIDLADVVVPFNTDGKARCARLELLEKVGL